MMRCCPVCHSSYTCTRQYLSEQMKAAYHQCQNIECTCTCTFKTVENLCQPLQSETMRIYDYPLPEKRTLNRYWRYCLNQTIHQ
ncbi:ogr/Delta-like zinc finger family protein [Serratia fonticola]